MQIIPGVWNEFGADGNGDGFRNPNNVYDAVTTVAVYLCSEGDDLKRPRDLVAPLLRYQHSKDFVATVLRWMRVYSKSAVLIPNAKGNLSTPKPTGNADRKVDPRQVPDVPDDTKTPTPTRPEADRRRRPTGKPSIPDPIDTPTDADPADAHADRPADAAADATPRRRRRHARRRPRPRRRPTPDPDADGHARRLTRARPRRTRPPAPRAAARTADSTGYGRRYDRNRRTQARRHGAAGR